MTSPPPPHQRSRIDANAKDAAENHEAHNTRRVAAGEAPVAYDPQYARHARHDVRDKYKTSAAIEKHTEDVTARQDHLADWAKAGWRTRVKLLPAHAKHKALEKLRPGYYKLPVKSSGVIEAPRPTRHHEHEAPPVGEDEVEYARQQEARRLWVPRKTAGVVHGEEEGAGGGLGGGEKKERGKGKRKGKGKGEGIEIAGGSEEEIEGDQGYREGGSQGGDLEFEPDFDSRPSTPGTGAGPSHRGPRHRS